jgi:hypothetical protein
MAVVVAVESFVISWASFHYAPMKDVQTIIFRPSGNMMSALKLMNLIDKGESNVGL